MFSYSLIGYAKLKGFARKPILSPHPSFRSVLFFFFYILDAVLYKNTQMGAAMTVWLAEKSM